MVTKSETILYWRAVKIKAHYDLNNLQNLKIDKSDTETMESDPKNGRKQK